MVSVESLGLVRPTHPRRMKPWQVVMIRRKLLMLYSDRSLLLQQPTFLLTLLLVNLSRPV